MSATPAGTAVSPGLTLTADTPWIVPPDQSEPLQRALEDIKRDWYKVLGHVPLILPAPPPGWNGPLVYFGLSAQRVPVGDVTSPTGRESFVLALEISSGGHPVVLATGADLRGSIYAAYAFSEEILGVDPWWFWAARRGLVLNMHHILVAGLNTFRGPPDVPFSHTRHPAIPRWAAGDCSGAIAFLEEALAEVEAVFGAMRLGERGKWAGWYVGEGLVGLDGSRDQLRVNLAAFRGEPAPLVRPRRAYEHICRYQERFRPNFPLPYRTTRKAPALGAGHSGV